MRRDRVGMLAVTAGPPLLLAILGLFHPMNLNEDTARTWRNLHVVLLPIFPLLGIAPWLVLRREGRVAGLIGAVLGYVYACFYTALDVLAGIGAGELAKFDLPGAPSVLFTQANELARYGVWAYLAAVVLVAAVVLRRAGARGLPGAVLLVGGAWSFLDSHIYWPRGVLTMLALAAGWVLVTLALPAPDQTGTPLA